MSEPVVPLTERWALSQEEVSQLLGMSVRTFQSSREKLRRAGFPSRLPGMNRFSAAAVRAWVDQQLVDDEPAGLADR